MTVTRETNDDKTLFRDLPPSREDSVECEEKNTPLSWLSLATAAKKARFHILMVVCLSDDDR